MDAIAEALGMNKGTLYHYYPSKSAILYELLSDQVDTTLQMLDEVPIDGSVWDRTRELIRLQVKYVSTKHDELVVFFQELPWIEQNLPVEQAADIRQRIEKYQQFTRQLLAAGVRSGEFRQINPQFLMYSIIGVLAYVPSWFRPGPSGGREALVNELTDFVMYGLKAKD